MFEIDETGIISVIPSANVSLGQYTLIVSAYNTTLPISRDTDEVKWFYCCAEILHLMVSPLSFTLYGEMFIFQFYLFSIIYLTNK